MALPPWPAAFGGGVSRITVAETQPGWCCGRSVVRLSEQDSESNSRGTRFSVTGPDDDALSSR